MAPQQTPGPPAVDEALFRFVTEMEVRKAVRLQYPVSVVTMIVPPDASGTRDPEDHLSRCGMAVGRVVRSMDVLTLLPALPGFRVLLADADRDEAEAIARRIQQELVHVAGVRFGLASFPGNVRNAGELIAEADDSARRAGSPDLV
jgi:hypothetical protein